VFRMSRALVGSCNNVEPTNYKSNGVKQVSTRPIGLVKLTSHPILVLAMSNWNQVHMLRRFHRPSFLDPYWST
jgi:hypothetical protein